MTNQNESLDVSAKTVEEAIEQGLSRLGLSRDQVEIQILNEGKRGILGFGSEDATVRLIPKRPLTEETPAAKPAAVPVEAEPEVEPIAEEEAPPVIPSLQIDEPEESEHDDIPAHDRRALEIAEKHLAKLLQLMGIEADIVVRPAPDLVDPGDEAPLVLDITGRDLGILIGRRNETLQALQYVVRLMVSKELGSWQRIVVDVESYRSRRRQTLHQIAKRMAERAVANRERVVLEAMPPYERRIIHMTLRDHPSVTTKSIGRENNRKVTIVPK
jgi:spoIIIJ-associated protein